MEPLLDYVQVCGSQTHQRIQEGKVPSAQQLDGFVTGIVTKFKDISKSLPAEVHENLACPWQPLWDFEGNCPGVEREKLDLQALLNICTCLREYLKDAAMPTDSQESASLPQRTAPTSPLTTSEPFDIATLLSYVGECGSLVALRIGEGKAPSAKQLDGFISGAVAKLKELTNEAPADVTEIVVRPWAQFWDFGENRCGTQRNKLDPPKVLEIFGCIRSGLRDLQEKQNVSRTVNVTVKGMNGSLLFGPELLPVSTHVSEISEKAGIAQGIDAGCSLKLLLGTEELVDDETLERWALHEALTLTSVVARRLPPPVGNYKISQSVNMREGSYDYKVHVTIEADEDGIGIVTWVDDIGGWRYNFDFFSARLKGSVTVGDGGALTFNLKGRSTHKRYEGADTVSETGFTCTGFVDSRGLHLNLAGIASPISELGTVRLQPCGDKA